MLKIFGILVGIIVVLIIIFVIYTAINNYKTLNTPRYKDNYYEDFKTSSELEKKYSQKGKYEVTNKEYKSDNKSIKNIRIWYPTELNDTDKKYPLVMVVNASGTPAKVYMPFFERLASWGFIVVGNDDPGAGSGKGSSETLDYILKRSEIKDKVDTDNMGIIGYSQGGAGAITAVTKYDNGKMYKTMFTGSAAYPALAKMMGWEYDAKDIKIPYFMTASTGTSDDANVEDINNNFAGVSPLSSLKATYKELSNDVFKILGRVKEAEHEDMLERTDGYMTAWMLYWLQNDEEASKVFMGENAEILSNANWQDIEKNN